MVTPKVIANTLAVLACALPLAGVPDGLHRNALLVDVASDSISKNAPPEAAGDRRRNNRIV